MAVAVESESQYESSGDGTSHAVPYPATITNGSILVLACSIDGTSAPTTPSGWAVADTTAGPSNTVTVYSITADGTETGNLSVTTPNQQFTAKMWSWTDGAAVEATATTGDSSTPDCPNHTPSGGNASYGLIAYAGQDSADSTWTTAISGYGNNGSAASTSGGPTSNGWARKVATVTSENPAAFADAAVQAWVAVTISIATAVAGGTKLWRASKLHGKV